MNYLIQSRVKPRDWRQGGYSSRGCNEVIYFILYNIPAIYQRAPLILIMIHIGQDSVSL